MLAAALDSAGGLPLGDGSEEGFPACSEFERQTGACTVKKSGKDC